MAFQSRVISASINGVEAVPVSVEVSIGSGLPGMSIVGMADTAIQEARERVRSAIKASGFDMPSEKIVINLAPSDIKKVGAGFDLPIALGILSATGQIDPNVYEGKLVAGELSLSGEVRCVSGDLAFCISASKSGLDYISGSRIKAPIDNMTQYCLDSLSRLRTEEPLSVLSRNKARYEQSYKGLDYSDVKGQECAKRAIQIAVAGRHGLLMIGPPGSGKSMLASRIPSIMPLLSQEESLETASIHSIAGERVESILSGIPPFRNPHHSATNAGLLGGGNPIRPGEASLAHNGVLFLDELAEFKPATLQGLRQPIEEGYITLTRATAKLKVPSKFMLIAATNPCPCGYYGDAERNCNCTYTMVRKYLSRIGGPLIDRFDMQLDVKRVSSQAIFQNGKSSSSATLKEAVYRCREFRKGRERKGFCQEPDSTRGAKEGLFEYMDLDDSAQKLAISMGEAGKMSGRAIKSMLNVSRTIADMEESEKVLAEHVAEAHAFRLSEIIGGY